MTIDFAGGALAMALVVSAFMMPFMPAGERRFGVWAMAVCAVGLVALTLLRG